MPATELERFIATWEREAKQTEKLLAALPPTQYDFRPDPKGRSLGEMAWHLAEIDGYMSRGVASGKFDFETKMPGLERPRVVAELAPGYKRVHEAAVAVVRSLKPERLDDSTPFMGRSMRNGDILWFVLLHHAIHHRGQLVLLTRLAGGVPPGLYGPTREEMAAMRGA
jgi:uncharacterized damage-inducible protein DinB